MTSCQFSAIEYFDPNDTPMQSNCDLESIVSKLENEFASVLETTESDTTDRTRAERRHYDKNEEYTTGKSTSQIAELDNCRCWSSRVEFVLNTSIWKLERQDLSKSDLSFIGKSSSIFKQESHEEQASFLDQTKQVSLKQSDGIKRESAIESVNVITNDTSLNSFTTFLRFYQQVLNRTNQAIKRSCSSKTIEILSNVSDGFDVSIPNDQDCSDESTKTNDLVNAIRQYPELYYSIRDWNLYQDAQSLLGSVCTAALLVGNRVRVYRTSGTTQWYTAVIISYDERTNLMTLIDDTVLEQHQEDPTLLEMHLIDGELVQSIIDGDDGTSNLGSSVRRRTQRSNQRQAAQIAQLAIMNSSTLGTNNGHHNGSSNAGSTTTTIKQPIKSLPHRALSPAPSAASSSSSSAFSNYQQHMTVDTPDQGQSIIDNRVNGKRINSSRQRNNKVSPKSKKVRRVQTCGNSDESGEY